MIRIYDVDKGGYVYANPNYITSIVPYARHGQNWSKIWIIGNAGYGTLEVVSNNTPDEIMDLIKEFQKNN